MNIQGENGGVKLLSADEKIVKHLRQYSRKEVENIVKAELPGDSEFAIKDPRFAYDVIIRNLVDIGYLDRDPHKNEYWLIARPSGLAQENPD